MWWDTGTVKPANSGHSVRGNRKTVCYYRWSLFTGTPTLSFFFLKNVESISQTRDRGIFGHDWPLWQASEQKKKGGGGCLNPPSPRMCLTGIITYSSATGLPRLSSFLAAPHSSAWKWRACLGVVSAPSRPAVFVSWLTSARSPSGLAPQRSGGTTCRPCPTRKKWEH